MSETETTASEDAPESVVETAPSPAPTPSFDFSDLRGFQSLGSPTQENPDAYAAELVKELTARADRFVQSVDDSVVLASDGVVRWLGDPVGRLVVGEETLKPRTVLLADDALPAEAREKVEHRLGLWVSAHLHKVLGPLEGLAAAEGLADGGREVAIKLAESLGVLDRERVRAQVKSLDQNARAALRKLGVRFGAHYIFIPALLKPGARTLCTQLQALKHAVEPGAERLLAYAAAGRTSFVAEGTLSPESYRVAGFRLCGERVVRVDIVERLTDLIRAAIPDQMRPGSAPASEAAGFLVTQQMTSLTGCAGEAFAAILRSLGYESHQVKKSEFEAATRKPAPAPIEPAKVSAAAVGEAEAHVAAQAPHEAEAGEEAARAVDETAVVSETPEVAESAEAEAPAQAVETEAEAAAETPEAREAESAPESVTEAEAPEASEAEAAPESVVEAETPEASEATSEEQADEAEAAPEAAAAEAEAAPEPVDELIEVWRPAPRQRRQHHHQHHHHQNRRHGSGSGEGTGRIVWRAKEPAAPAPASSKAEIPVAAEAGDATAEPPQREESSRGRNGDHRPQQQKGPRRDERRQEFAAKGQVDAGPRREQRAMPVDPDSPFAKLLALKPLLEKQDRKK